MTKNHDFGMQLLRTPQALFTQGSAQDRPSVTTRTNRTFY